MDSNYLSKEIEKIKRKKFITENDKNENEIKILNEFYNFDYNRYEIEIELPVGVL